MVVRARLAEGAVPLEHADALARVAEDGRIKVRQRRVAAELLGRLRLAGMGVVATGAHVRRLRADHPSRDVRGAHQ